jgi:hypothetical protein
MALVRVETLADAILALDRLRDPATESQAPRC